MKLFTEASERLLGHPGHILLVKLALLVFSVESDWWKPDLLHALIIMVEITLSYLLFTEKGDRLDLKTLMKGILEGVRQGLVEQAVVVGHIVLVFLMFILFKHEGFSLDWETAMSPALLNRLRLTILLSQPLNLVLIEVGWSFEGMTPLMILLTCSALHHACMLYSPHLTTIACHWEHSHLICWVSCRDFGAHGPWRSALIDLDCGDGSRFQCHLMRRLYIDWSLFVYRVSPMCICSGRLRPLITLVLSWVVSMSCGERWRYGFIEYFGILIGWHIWCTTVTSVVRGSDCLYRDAMHSVWLQLLLLLLRPLWLLDMLLL